eukprot:3888152-Alexandrium_andersonii.AAC.1
MLEKVKDGSFAPDETRSGMIRSVALAEPEVAGPPVGRDAIWRGTPLPPGRGIVGGAPCRRGPSAVAPTA